MNVERGDYELSRRGLPRALLGAPTFRGGSGRRPSSSARPGTAPAGGRSWAGGNPSEPPMDLGYHRPSHRSREVRQI